MEYISLRSQETVTAFCGNSIVDFISTRLATYEYDKGFSIQRFIPQTGHYIQSELGPTIDVTIADWVLLYEDHCCHSRKPFSIISDAAFVQSLLEVSP